MAYADYRHCDVCDSKVFYDANLNYEQSDARTTLQEDEIARVAGVPQGKYGVRLDYLGDWAVICRDCAKTHKCIVVPADPKGESSTQGVLAEDVAAYGKGWPNGDGGHTA